jgi:hypothetical protein
MLTKQEQEILDNAPEGATHWMTHNTCAPCYGYSHNDSIFDSRRVIASFMSEWTATPLADLRKKQGNSLTLGGAGPTAAETPEGLRSMGDAVNSKPRTKVEHVPMTTSHHYEIFKAMHDDGDVYVKCEDGEYEGMQGCIINLADAIHDEVTIYRKVETEIKTEKRWLMYEESSDTFTPCREDQGAVVGFQVIEITVEV